MTKHLAMALAVVLTSGGSVLAGPELEGVAVNRTLAVGNANPALGAGSRARQALGVVNGATAVNGVLANTTVASGNTNASTGTARGRLPDWGRGRFGR
jgi:hypothetical protein